MKLRICFEADGLAVDVDGNPAPAGLTMTLGEIEKQVDYWEFIKTISIADILKLACLDGIVKPADVRIITPEEYDEKYGGETDEPEEALANDRV